jgi:Cu/Ag efflux protein CusF
MRLWRNVAAVAVATAMLWSGAALAQVKSTDCDPAHYPKKVEGQVTKIDMNAGKVTVRTADGTVHEFQASKETLQDLKTGDHIAMQLRSAPKC